MESLRDDRRSMLIWGPTERVNHRVPFLYVWFWRTISLFSFCLQGCGVEEERGTLWRAPPLFLKENKDARVRCAQLSKRLALDGIWMRFYCHFSKDSTNLSNMMVGGRGKEKKKKERERKRACHPLKTDSIFVAYGIDSTSNSTLIRLFLLKIIPNGYLPENKGFYKIGKVSPFQISIPIGSQETRAV